MIELISSLLTIRETLFLPIQIVTAKSSKHITALPKSLSSNSQIFHSDYNFSNDIWLSLESIKLLNISLGNFITLFEFIYVNKVSKPSINILNSTLHSWFPLFLQNNFKPMFTTLSLFFLLYVINSLRPSFNRIIFLLVSFWNAKLFIGNFVWSIPKKLTISSHISSFDSISLMYGNS